jgi:hypothetical protein
MRDELALSRTKSAIGNSDRFFWSRSVMGPSTWVKHTLPPNWRDADCETCGLWQHGPIVMAVGRR